MAKAYFGDHPGRLEIPGKCLNLSCLTRTPRLSRDIIVNPPYSEEEMECIIDTPDFDPGKKYPIRIDETEYLLDIFNLCSYLNFRPVILEKISNKLQGNWDHQTIFEYCMLERHLSSCNYFARYNDNEHWLLVSYTLNDFGIKKFGNNM